MTYKPNKIIKIEELRIRNKLVININFTDK